MDQAKNAGHHAITREAVRELFAKRAQNGQGDSDRWHG
jgi:hypothetical protein